MANALIRACAEERGVDFLDVHTPMLGPDGEADPRWFDQDGLHLNAHGYALWAGVVREWLARRGLC
jgi:lysophospholipase L1-like esterase